MTSTDTFANLEFAFFIFLRALIFAVNSFLSKMDLKKDSIIFIVILIPAVSP